MIYLLMFLAHMIGNFWLPLSSGLFYLRVEEFWIKTFGNSTRGESYYVILSLSLAWSIIVHLPLAFIVDDMLNNQLIFISIASNSFIHALIDMLHIKKIFLKSFTVTQLVYLVQILVIFLLFSLNY